MIIDYHIDELLETEIIDLFLIYSITSLTVVLDRKSRECESSSSHNSVLL